MPTPEAELKARLMTKAEAVIDELLATGHALVTPGRRTDAGPARGCHDRQL